MKDLYLELQFNIYYKWNFQSSFGDFICTVEETHSATALSLSSQWITLKVLIMQNFLHEKHNKISSLQLELYIQFSIRLISILGDFIWIITD